MFCYWQCATKQSPLNTTSVAASSIDTTPAQITDTDNFTSSILGNNNIFYSSTLSKDFIQYLSKPGNQLKHTQQLKIFLRLIISCVPNNFRLYIKNIYLFVFYLMVRAPSKTCIVSNPLCSTGKQYYISMPIYIYILYKYIRTYCTWLKRGNNINKRVSFSN